MNNPLRILFALIISTLILLCSWAYFDFTSVRSSSYPSNTYRFDLIRLLLCVMLTFSCTHLLKGESFNKRFLIAGGIMVLATMITTLTMLLAGDGIHQYLTENF